MSRFEAIVRTMLDVHEAKNHDYSQQGQFGNFNESERIGIPAWKGAFIRLTDKYTRACNLIARDGQARVLDEKLEDTLLDLANYAVIVLCLLEEAAKAKTRPGPAKPEPGSGPATIQDSQAHTTTYPGPETPSKPSKPPKFLKWTPAPVATPI